MARADEVELRGRPLFREVRIEALRENLLVFRGVSGFMLRRPLEQIELIQVDGCDALNAAERLRRAGDWDAASDAYADLPADGRRAWLAEFVHRRAADTHERAGRIDRVVESLLAAFEAQTELPLPKRAAASGSDANRRARERLATAMDNADPRFVSTLRRLHLELMIIDDLPVPAEFKQRPSASVVADADSTRAQHLPRRTALPPDDSARARESPPQGQTAAGSAATACEADALPAAARPATALPADDALPPAASRPVGAAAELALRAAPRLPADSLVVHEAQAALERGDAGRAVRLLRRGVAFATSDERQTWLLRLGVALLENREPHAAQQALEQVVPVARESAERAAALYHLGLACEQLGQPARAARCLQQALESRALPAGLQRQAQAALLRNGEAR